MPSVLQHLLRTIGHLPVPGARRVVWQFHRALANPRSSNFEINFHGLRYRGRLDDLIDWNIFFFGGYSEAELDFLAEAARAIATTSKDVFYFDVGANVGQHALFMSRLVTGVVAFEPARAARERFEMNAALNGLSNIRLYPIALGDCDEEGVLGSGFAGNSGSRSLTWTLDQRNTEKIEIRRGDDLVQSDRLPPMDILKLDVEGFEKRVLCGLRESISRDRPVILMELVGKSQKSGFSDVTDLRGTLYSDHELFTLRGQRRAKLAPFDWDSEAVVCLPKERVKAFANRMAS